MAALLHEKVDRLQSQQTQQGQQAQHDEAGAAERQ